MFVPACVPLCKQASVEYHKTALLQLCGRCDVDLRGNCYHYTKTFVVVPTYHTLNVYLELLSSKHILTTFPREMKKKKFQ